MRETVTKRRRGRKKVLETRRNKAKISCENGLLHPLVNENVCPYLQHDIL